MSIELRHKTTISGGSVSINSPAISRSGSGGIGLEETLPFAQAGVLTTRTDADTGTITMGSGSHTISNGNVVDVYWAAGVHYGATVGTVSTTTVPIDSGTGDDLPSADTAVVVVPQFSANVAIDGDNVALIVMILETTTKSLRDAGHVQLRDVSNAEIAEVDLVANVPKVYDITGGDSNPFTGNPITNIKASTAGTSATETYQFKIVGVVDASP